MGKDVILPSGALSLMEERHVLMESDGDQQWGRERCGRPWVQWEWQGEREGWRKGPVLGLGTLVLLGTIGGAGWVTVGHISVGLGMYRGVCPGSTWFCDLESETPPPKGETWGHMKTVR